MQIHYDSRTDLLYLRLDDGRQPVVNRRVSDDIVLDVGPDDRMVGIEIMDASKHVRMDHLLPVTYLQERTLKTPALVREREVAYRTRPQTKRK
jgi:uncharacterized protein YuzE